MPKHELYDRPGPSDSCMPEFAQAATALSDRDSLSCLGAEYLRPKKVNLLNCSRFVFV